MKIIENMGKVDRIIRLVISTVLVILIATQNLTGIIAIVAGVVALIFFVTSVVSFCPLYTVFGISTCNVSKDKK